MQVFWERQKGAEKAGQALEVVADRHTSELYHLQTESQELQGWCGSPSCVWRNPPPPPPPQALAKLIKNLEAAAAAGTISCIWRAYSQRGKDYNRVLQRTELLP